MEIQQLEKYSAAHTNVFTTFQKLLEELRKRTLPAEVIEFINRQINEINSFTGTEKDLSAQVKKSQTEILKLIEKDMKLVPKNHYRTMWLALGMASFGLPLGVVFGLSLGNMAFLAIGLPFGMGIGVAVGTALDKKAAAEGNQLDLEIGH